MNINIPTIPLPFGRRAKRAAARMRTFGWVFLGLSVLAGSTSPSFAKQLTSSFSPLSLLFLSEVLLITFSMLSFGLLPLIKKVIVLSKKELIPLFIVGITNGVIGPYLWFAGISQTTAVNAELFGRSDLILILLLSMIFLRENLKRVQVAAVGVILLGLTVVGTRGFGTGLDLQMGDLMILCGVTSFSVGAIVFKKFLPKIDPEVPMFIRSSCAIGVFFLVSPFLEHSFVEEIGSFPLEMIWIIVAYGLISRFLSLYSYYQSVERLPVSTVSILGTLTIVGSVLCAGFYLGEDLFWHHALGSALIISGAVLMRIGDFPRLKKRHLHHYVHINHRHIL